MLKDDAGVCAPDELPDATVSFPNMRGEVAPDRARDCGLDGKCKPLRPTPDEVTIAADSTTSDPEEKEEATPLVLDAGSPPSIAARAALFEVPPLVEFSPSGSDTVVGRHLSVRRDASNNPFFLLIAPVFAPRADTADNLRNPAF